MALPNIRLNAAMPDGDGDGKIKIGSTKYATITKSPIGTVWELVKGEPDFTYRDITVYKEEPAPTPTPEPTPPPPPPPAPEPSPPPPPASDLTSAMQGGEAFLQTDAMTVGFNPYGGIGTLKNAPDGFRANTAVGLYRVGIYVPPLSDIVLQGRAIEGFGIMVAGKRYANMQLTGFTQVPGGFSGPLLWQGKVAGVDVTQSVTMSGRVLRIAVTLTNTTSAPLDVQYFRAIDPDQADAFSTTNAVVAAGVLEARFKGGKLVMRAAGAEFAVQPYNASWDIGTRRDVGASNAADETVQAVFPRDTLVSGQSVTRVIEYEVVVS